MNWSGEERRGKEREERIRTEREGETSERETGRERGRERGPAVVDREGASLLVSRMSSWAWS